jgi:NADPH-dependent 2,4-dienoyl-CoA reductase/sulfur reductase-like enzyme
LYKGIVERVALSDGGAVTRVDAAAMTVSTDFDTHKAEVATIIPPQRAGSIALAAGVADKTGWCPVDPMTFESKRIAGIHVLGDAAIMGAMPKSAFAANAQAKVCADAIIAMLAGQKPQEPRLINTCYSLAAPGYAFSVAGVYRPSFGQLIEVEGSGGPSPIDATPETRKQEADYAEIWYQTITGAVFG